VNMSVFTDYVLPIGVGAAAGAAGYYGWLPQAITTPLLVCSGIQLLDGSEGLNITGRCSKIWTKYCEKASAAWSAWNQPHIDATPARIARMTAELEENDELKKLEQKVEDLKQKIKGKKETVKGLKSLARESKDDVLKGNEKVREVLERGPTKKTAAVKSASGNRVVDIDNLAEQHIRGLNKQKFFHGKGGAIRPTWKSHEAAANVKKELDDLVGADEGQISKADRDAVWKEIRDAFPEF
jgi:hypothetical protein